MADYQLKDIFFNPEYFNLLGSTILRHDKSFDNKGFLKTVLASYKDFELNQRMRLCTESLHIHLPGDYQKHISIFSKAIIELPNGYQNLIFPDYIAHYGLQYPELSIPALKQYTVYGSSEFAIRHFLKHDLKATLKHLYAWSKDNNEHVRRLSSEGSRPRLPWSFSLPEIINNPSLTAPILNQLKSDDSLYVRKSVANHLNDISKDNPQFMLDMISAWDLKHKHTAWIVKHACRTLIKKGDTRTLALFSFKKDIKVQVGGIKLSKKSIKLGESLEFSFTIESKSKQDQDLVIDYAIHYAKKSGEQAPKVFKLKELTLAAGQKITLSKKQVFKDMTTRVHYPGKHVVEILINGNNVSKTEFKIVMGN